MHRVSTFCRIERTSLWTGRALLNGFGRNATAYPSITGEEAHEQMPTMDPKKPRETNRPGVPDRDDVNNPIEPSRENDLPVDEPPAERRRRDDKEDKEEHLL